MGLGTEAGEKDLSHFEKDNDSNKNRGISKNILDGVRLG